MDISPPPSVPVGYCIYQCSSCGRASIIRDHSCCGTHFIEVEAHYQVEKYNEHCC